MRTDVKLGLIGSFVIVLVAGWYFTGRDNPKPAIPLGGSVSVLPSSGPSVTMLTGVDSEEGFQESDVEQTPTTTEVVSAKPAPSEQNPPIEHVSNARRSGRDGSASDPFAEPEDESPLIINDDEPARRVVHAPPKTSPPTGTVLSDQIHAEVPQPSHADAAAPRRFETHTVQPGDTFAALARQFFGDVRFAQTIRDANPQVEDAAAMAVGTVVVIPDIGEVSTARSAAPKKEAARGQSGSTDGSYVVREGDTLYAIARDRLGAGGRWMDIYKINKAVIGGDPGALKVGMKIILPPRS